MIYFELNVGNFAQAMALPDILLPTALLSYDWLNQFQYAITYPNILQLSHSLSINANKLALITVKHSECSRTVMP